MRRGDLVAEPTGKVVTWDGLDVIPFEDGLVKRKDVYSDSVTILNALGLSLKRGRRSQVPATFAAVKVLARVAVAARELDRADDLRRALPLALFQSTLISTSVPATGSVSLTWNFPFFEIGTLGFEIGTSYSSHCRGRVVDAL